MAKKQYQIRDSLDKNHGDIEINLSSDKTGISLRPLPVKIIGCFVLSICLLFLVLSKTFISSGGFVWCLLFAILWIVLTIVLLTRDKTNRPQYSFISSMMSYLPKKMRYVFTRRSSNPFSLYNIIGIDYIDEDHGCIHFIDGTVGNVYLVVGSASFLLFDEDKEHILDRVENFYTNMLPDYEVIYITTKAAQNVYSQLGALKRRAESLTVNDPDLNNLALAQEVLLRDVIGSSFKSTHQYMILKADNEEALALARNTLRGECENSQLMFKRIEGMLDDDLIDVFKHIFRGE